MTKELFETPDFGLAIYLARLGFSHSSRIEDHNPKNPGFPRTLFGFEKSEALTDELGRWYAEKESLRKELPNG